MDCFLVFFLVCRVLLKKSFNLSFSFILLFPLLQTTGSLLHWCSFLWKYQSLPQPHVRAQLVRLSSVHETPGPALSTHCLLCQWKHQSWRGAWVSFSYFNLCSSVFLQCCVCCCYNTVPCLFLFLFFFGPPPLRKSEQIKQRKTKLKNNNAVQDSRAK